MVKGGTMRKYILIGLVLILFAFPAQAANKFYWATGLTGGGAALDGIDGTGLAAGDAAIVILDSGTNQPIFYFYRLQASSAAEASPTVIVPNSNAGTSAWHLSGVVLDSTQGITLGSAGVKLSASNGSITILGLGDGQDEDMKIDLNTTANQITISSPASSADTVSLSALNLVTTGNINGGIKVEKDDDSLAAAQCYGTFHWYSGGAETITLPAAVVGMNLCVYASDATVKNIDPNGTDTIVLNGTALTAGYQIESPGAAGNFICLMSFTANQWTTLGQSGVWITHGAD
jgi:hypothetical protein